MLMIRKQSISDYDEEKAGYHFNIEREDKEMYLKFLKKTAEVRQLSDSDANTLVGDESRDIGISGTRWRFPCLEEAEEGYSQEDP
jgi:ATP phosphoribosyltransferase